MNTTTSTPEADDPEIHTSTANHEAADWKARVTKRSDPAEWPTESLFQKGERVWITTPGSRGVRGPYRIVEVLPGNSEQYRVRDEAAGGSGAEEQVAGANMRRRL